MTQILINFVTKLTIVNDNQNFKRLYRLVEIIQIMVKETLVVLTSSFVHWGDVVVGAKGLIDLLQG